MIEKVDSHKMFILFKIQQNFAKIRNYTKVLSQKVSNFLSFHKHSSIGLEPVKSFISFSEAIFLIDQKISAENNIRWDLGNITTQNFTATFLLMQIHELVLYGHTILLDGCIMKTKHPIPFKDIPAPIGMGNTYFNEDYTIIFSPKNKPLYTLFSFEKNEFEKILEKKFYFDIES